MAVRQTTEEIVTSSLEDKVIAEVLEELAASQDAHGSMHSLHEGYAILKEEVDELWDEIKVKQSHRNPSAVRKEAIQVAAMALRLLTDRHAELYPETLAEPLNGWYMNEPLVGKAPGDF